MNRDEEIRKDLEHQWQKEEPTTTGGCNKRN